MTIKKIENNTFLQMDLPEAPAGVDCRALLMRSAAIGTAAILTSNEIPANRRVDFDTTVKAMALTAEEMNSKYQETSEVGLTVSVVLC